MSLSEIVLEIGKVKMNIEAIDQHLSEQEFTSAGDVRLVHNDGFSWLPDGSIDLVLTDPPYNVARDTNFHIGPRLFICRR